MPKRSALQNDGKKSARLWSIIFQKMPTWQQYMLLHLGFFDRWGATHYQCKAHCCYRSNDSSPPFIYSCSWNVLERWILSKQLWNYGELNSSVAMSTMTPQDPMPCILHYLVKEHIKQLKRKLDNIILYCIPSTARDMKLKVTTNNSVRMFTKLYVHRLFASLWQCHEWLTCNSIFNSRSYETQIQ